MQKTLYIIAGCNGAGKTTASFTILPDFLNCKEFVNADEIARGLSPFQPETVAMEAGRLMLMRMDTLMNSKTTFAFETTLATKSYKNRIRNARTQGYTIVLLFFWLRKVELAIKRVKIRVQEGGHNIETETIKRRYVSGIRNLFQIYLPLVDEAMLFDNSEGRYELIAEQNTDSGMHIANEEKFTILQQLEIV
ncbi:zeta toxin family protein [Cytophagaceae bacterium DM2B3-1]|uniref:Zeta toxin family protein n=1 Tax=Xanthocytophaga flava TaxID=3048013 RepID=A0ABT7CKJ2_9BACT|nr:zeta toxin family protein [Xanthocytophaga flavus]MDJ1494252.1 zeta toxin family protein [Xanthocytophaga flavus]